MHEPGTQTVIGKIFTHYGVAQGHDA